MQDPAFVRQAFAEIAPRYVLTNHVLSLGIDVLWRRRVAALASEVRPARVLDVATGSGDLAASVQAACPAALVVGIDFCAPMLVHAQRRGLRHLLVADGMQLPFAAGTFDLVTIGFGLRNMADYPAAAREMGRVLRPRGRLVVLDFSLPENLFRAPYRLYLHHLLPMIAGMLTGRRSAYQYLAGSIETFPSGRQMMALLEVNGFASTQWIPLTGGVASIYVATVAGAD
jgi:demethylmenaquinone methyltransferase/2-methoxy-6-polyprenyl-1,4-benzoquinol methylase